MTTTQNAVVLNNKNYKLLNVARAWINDRMNAEGTSPEITVKFDQNLGINITMGAGSQFVFFKNAKREGKQDADYRVAVSIPTEIADKEIARQKAISEERKASEGSVTVTPA